MNMGGGKDYKVIKELYHSSRYLISLQLIAWGDLPPVIVKIKSYMDKQEGKIKYSRLIGLNKYDLEFIHDNYQSIMNDIDAYEARKK